MNEFQKVIKYIALAFAIFLSITILSSIAAGLLSLVTALSDGSNVKTTSFNKTFEDVKSIKIDCATTNFNIEASDHFEIDAVNVPENLKAEMNGDTLKITSKSYGIHLGFINIGNSPKDSKITLYVPEDFKAKNVMIDIGAGKFDIKWLLTENLDIDAGIGNINGENITADKFEIDCGVGNINLSNVNSKNTEIDGGVGNIDIQGQLLGKTKIDGGAGNIDLSLVGEKKDYNLKADKGVGSLRINGEKYNKSDWDNTSADNFIDVDCGVGNTDIDFN